MAKSNGPTGKVGDLLTGLLGVGLALPLELLSLGSLDSAILWAVATLYATAGLAIGATLALTGFIVRRLRATGASAALIRGGGSLLVFVPLLRHLFDGGYAATLPGASHGPIVGPAVAFVLVAAAVWVGRAVDRPRGDRIRA